MSRARAAGATIVPKQLTATAAATEHRIHVAMRRFAIGAAHRGRRILALLDDATVVDLETGEVIATNDIQPDRSGRRTTQKAPGRWPEARSPRDRCRDAGETYVATRRR